MKWIFSLFLFLDSISAFGAVRFIEVENKKRVELKSSKVRIFGNKIFSEEKIDEIIRFKGKDISKGEMDYLLRKLEKFYIANGYELIEVDYLFIMDEWYVFINEGRLGKVIIKGENTINTFLLKNVFTFKENIFNAVEMKNLIRAVKKNYGFSKIQYRLLPIKKEKKSLLNFSDTIERLVRFESPESYIEPNYDLLIAVKKRDWGDGVGGSITYNSSGLISGVSFSDSSLILNNDRLKSTIKGGVDLRNDLRNNENDLVLTLIAFELAYFPFLFRARYFKPSIELLLSDNSFQRGDIQLNEYRIFTQDFSLYAGFELKKDMILSCGIGEEFLYTHNFEYVKEYENKLKEISLFRGYVSTTLNYLIDEPNLRLDLREHLKIKVRYYIPSDKQSHWFFSSDYSKSMLFGFDYAKLFLGFKLLTGDIPFFDEFSIAYSSFKSSFSDRYYARDAIYSGIEYNISLYKDIFHVGVFTDFTLFYYMDYNDEKMYWLGAIDIGGGIRLLFFDMFLLKIDYAPAYAFNGKSDRNLLFSISKVF
ncbi:MAG: hypothetical protein N2746_01550 [Deltaproteobacteria bacterium]|nr:hypothetical protein [Deltaproteobacteria bacterium]